jgi:hypothetical protein
MSATLPAGSVILFVTALPGDQEMLDTNEEFRLMDEAVRDRFILRAKLAARPEDLVFALAELKPRVLHFSGHGAGPKGLVFQKAKGKSALFTDKALTALLETSLLGPGQLAVLSACSTASQAEKIAAKGCSVVAMKWDVLDALAKEFASAFYRLLCSQPPAEAFRSALAVLKAKRVPEADTPEFYAGKAVSLSGDPAAESGNSISQGALRKFIADHVPEDSLANLETDIVDYRRAMGAALDHMGKSERARRLIGWLAERQRLAELVSRLREEVPELVQKHETGWHSRP